MGEVFCFLEELVARNEHATERGIFMIYIQSTTA